MIEIKDLRIGNIVDAITNDRGVVTQIRSQNTKNEYFQSVHFSNKIFFLPEHIIPIPLTAEWLERLGFEKSREGMYINGEFEITSTIEPPTMYKCYKVFPIGKEIAYVHTLQNVFYALTRNELNLK